MQKRANSSTNLYQRIFSPLPVDAEAILYFDRKPAGLPYAEDFPMLHYHDRYEIGVCESGEGLFLSDGLFYSVSRGDLIFVAPGRCHYSRSLNQDAPCICRFSYLHAETVKRLISLASSENEKRTTVEGIEQTIPIVLRTSEYPEATILLSAVMDICKRGTSCDEGVAALTLSIFLMEARNIFQNIHPIECAPHKSDDAVVKISEYLSLHYNRSDTALELANKCFLSESQLRRRFLAVYGMPPIAYRNSLRCKIAAELLMRSPMPISEIAEQIGYTTTSDLYKAFKKIYGISPAAYRSENSL